MSEENNSAPPPQSPQSPPPEPPVEPAAAATGEISQDQRQFAMFTHLSALIGFIGVPLGNILGPLVLWLIKKDSMPFVDDQGKEALNFQITLFIAAFISAILTIVLIGFLLLLAVWIVGIVFVIIAALKANEGVAYRYPMTIRLIK